MPQRQTLTRKILRHRGFVPVASLIFLSVLISVAARYSDYRQGRLNVSGIRAVAVVTEKNATGIVGADRGKNGAKPTYWIIMEFTHTGGKIQRLRRKVDKQGFDGIAKGDRFYVRYDPKNPRVFELADDEFGTLADKIRIVAWVFFLAGCLLAAHHFLQAWLARRRKRQAG